MTYVSDMKKGTDPAEYPRKGTKKARILECLAAEPSRAVEVMEYIGGGNYSSVRAMLHQMGRRGIVFRIKTCRWALTSPETEASVHLCRISPKKAARRARYQKNKEKELAWAKAYREKKRAALMDGS